MTRLHRAFFVASLFCAAPAVQAYVVSYNITINTTALSGTTGFLDFQFNPGPNSVAPANAYLSGFSSSGVLDLTGLFTSGDVSGNLPGTVTFDNGTPLNDYSPNFTFGSSIAFQVSLAWTQPVLPPASGSAFVFYMYQNSSGQFFTGAPSPDGRAFDLNIDPNGGTTVNNDFASAVSIVPNGVTVTPEPGGMGAMLALALAALVVRARGKRV